MKHDYNAADVAFVQEMIPHHETAVKMANAYLNKGQNSMIKAAADAIVTGQAEEIRKFKAWLERRGGGAGDGKSPSMRSM